MKAKYKAGQLTYNEQEKCYGLRASCGWLDSGFLCGECMEVMVDGKWVKTRMEIAWKENGTEWYLVGTPYTGNLENIATRIGC